MPQVHVLDLKRNLFICRLDLADLVAFLITDSVSDLLTVGQLGGENLDLNGSLCSINCGSDLQTAAAIVIKIKMALVHAYKVNVAVNTAVERKVSHLRVYGLVCGIIHEDSDLGLVGQLLGNIHTPGRITAVVVSKLLTANVNVRRRVCAANFKIIAICFGQISLF